MRHILAVFYLARRDMGHLFPVGGVVRGLATGVAAVFIAAQIPVGTVGVGATIVKGMDAHNVGAIRTVT